MSPRNRNTLRNTVVGVAAGAAIASFAYKQYKSSTGKRTITPKVYPKPDIPKTPIRRPKSEETYGGLIVAETLKAHGVKIVFTLTGGHISPILVGCNREGVRVIDVRHEVSTAFAADAISRLTGQVGVAIVTAGPGLSNTITSIKNAQLAQSPLVLLGGAAPTIFKGRGALQDIDQQAMFKPHVKWSTTINRVADIVPMLETAFQEAQSGVPGPVFVEFPLDLLYPEKIIRDQLIGALKKMKGVQGTFLRWYLNRHYNNVYAGLYDIQPAQPRPITYPRPDLDLVKQAAQALRKAKRPLLMVGSQAMLHACDEADLAAAVNKLGVPTYLSSMARGLLGRVSSVQKRHKRTLALADADVVILAGVACDFRLEYGNHIKGKSFYISANRSPIDLYKNKSPNLAILGDPALFVVELAKAVGTIVPSTRFDSWHEHLNERENAREAAIDNDAKLNVFMGGESSVGCINPIKLCREVEEVIDEDGIIIGDGGDFVGTASYILHPRGPLCWLDPGVFGTLGVGGGFAMAAKAANPDKEVWIMFGDGSFGYSLSEFDTYVRHDLPVIAVIGNDACWMQMYRGQIDMFKDETACVLNYTDYQDCVKGFGAAGLIIRKEEEIRSVLLEAKRIAKSGKPVVVNCLIGKTDFRKGSISV